MTDAKQAEVLNDLSTQQNSEWECELASLRHEVLSESRDLDYRILCNFFAGEFGEKNLQIRVFRISFLER